MSLGEAAGWLKRRLLEIIECLDISPAGSVTIFFFGWIIGLVIGVIWL